MGSQRIIEIHPGDRKNSFENIACFIRGLLERYHKEYQFYPLILLENRTDQFISNGKEISAYWECIQGDHSDLVKYTGVILDVQQLFTRTSGNFFSEYDSIPFDSVKGFHIHTKHRRPRLGDGIPWKYVFGRIAQMDHDIIINPEIHQKNWVRQTIEFCEDLLA